ncbi:DUF4292 domain-containing protein [Anditalea andensis]|uniref:Deoxyuridine 5'-triphosphate nucleotidohydrolase n=1 Tax=Anditalea andensis TaxID=1048983 RepID=A0A074KXE3_9BACT|nr:DUF4292 domain-containing protein [Anditalea andensis]KEO74631.1 hypothetical protein EL17_02860 [Anditalea andensis]
MNKFLRFSYLILVLVIAASCARRPNLYTSDEIMEEFTPAYLEFTYLTARARVVLEEPNGKTTRGTLNLRAKKDSALWFSITPGLGIEAARGLVTQEKIQFKDRINGNAIDMTFQEFEERFGLVLSLDLFQNVLFANIPHEFSYRDRLLRVGRTFELDQRRQRMAYHSIISARHGKVQELETSSQSMNGKLSATYPEFKDLENQPFPYRMLLKLIFDPQDDNGPVETTVNLEMNRVELVDDPLTFPYNY